MTEGTATKKMEFVKKKDLDLSSLDITTVSAKQVIQNAKPEEILGLTITINSPVKIVDAEIVDGTSFEKLFFSGLN